MPILDGFNRQGHDAPKGTQTSVRRPNTTPQSQRPSTPRAPGAMPPGSSFTPQPFGGVTPEYSNQGAWSGWGGAAPTTGNVPNRAGQGVYRGVTGALGMDQWTVEDYYRNLHGDALVEQAKRSGLDPAVFFNATPKVQQIAAQWGTNLPNVGDITAQQRSQYEQQAAQQRQTNASLDEFGALDAFQRDNLMQQFLNGSGMAQARYDLGTEQLMQGLGTDLSMLNQRRYRDVDLAGQDNAANLLHNANMRGVLDERRGIRGDSFQQQQSYLNQQTGFLNDRQNLAFDQFQNTDRYAAGLAQDLMAQYGFNAEQYAQDTQEAFSNRNTQQRAATSDAAARGAFGSAGFGDNISDIYGQYERSQDASGLRMDRVNEGLDVTNRGIANDRENLRFGYEGQQIGFRDDAAGINDAQQRNTLGYRDDLATMRGQYSANDRERSNLQNVDKSLASLAKEYGVREQDIRNQFNNQVDAMGLDLNETTNQLGDMLNSGNAQLQAQAMQFMTQFMALQ